MSGNASSARLPVPHIINACQDRLARLTRWEEDEIDKIVDRQMSKKWFRARTRKEALEHNEIPVLIVKARASETRERAENLLALAIAAKDCGALAIDVSANDFAKIQHDFRREPDRTD